jgi:glutaredoxin
MEENKENEVSVTEQVEETSTEKQKKVKPLNKKFIAGLIVIVSIAVLYSGYNNGKFNKVLNSVGQSGPVTIEASEIQKLIDENVLQDGMTSEVKDIVEENGFYKFKLVIGGQEYESYMTKDKSMLFPQGVTVTEENGFYKIAQTNQGQEYVSYMTKDSKMFFPTVINFAKMQEEKAATEAEALKAKEEQKANMTKSAKPQVELFVMSECPYGTQVEKGILPVAEALGDKIDFSIKFCDYAMHGEKELNEQLQQYCINQNEPEKFIPYLKCYLGAGDSATCLTNTNINKTKLKSCVSATDTKYKVTEKFEDESSWRNGKYPLFPIYQADVDKYTVEGSPTLIINGQKIDSDRDPKSILEMVCAGFENAPEECSKALSSATPSIGFGFESADSGTSADASCSE